MLHYLQGDTRFPLSAKPDECAHAWESFLDARRNADAELQQFAQQAAKDTKTHALLDAIFGNSPYLTQVILKHPEWLRELCLTKPEDSLASLHQQLSAAETTAHALRVAKKHVSLIVAAADISGHWKPDRVTRALSDFADLTLELTLNYLLRQAAAKGEITPEDPADPQKNCGLLILALGKLGAHELNYSSDIDLMIFFDKDRLRYAGSQTVQHFCNRLTQDLVKLLQERTAEGYVFRVDLRLRPDPASTPPAMSTNGALTYYETVGQNWERAALTKARLVAGDKEAERWFFSQLTPFIWRKHLDFAAIEDIQSIKRQMDTYNQAALEIPGHNIKTGIGGIREIEFLAQIYQLIWGGRNPRLRSSSTSRTLAVLAEEGLISLELADRLTEIYWYLRHVEHRLQMILDEQTHTIPESMKEIEHLALFCGFASGQSFCDDLEEKCRYVHGIYTESFKGKGSLAVEGKLSFTGVEADPETVATLTKIGFKNPTTVAEVIAGWHRGTRRATRTKRARELITEVTPALLKAMAATANPDQAFIRFDEFLAKLPAGVQLFSLFNSNPNLLSLIATIMGSAPALADALARNPSLLDAVLTGHFLHELPDRTLLTMEFTNAVLLARDTEDEIIIQRQFKNEKQFQVGIQLLTGRIDALVAAEFLSTLADILLTAVLRQVERDFARTYGRFTDHGLAVIGLGKLGAHELTFGSDLDLILVYDDPKKEASEDGEKSLGATEYYARLSQRFIGALTAPTKEGRLYEVDMRLRPSGNQGPISVGLSGFDKYFSESAWTFERMALTRARAVAGTQEMKERITNMIRAQLLRPQNKKKLMEDIHSLRDKIAQEHGTGNPWNIKYARGGLMDIDFLAQFLMLANAHDCPQILHRSTGVVLQEAMIQEIIDQSTGQSLASAFLFLTTVFFLLRLASSGSLDAEQAPQGLKTLLATTLKMPDFETLQRQLLETEDYVNQQFSRLIAN